MSLQTVPGFNGFIYNRISSMDGRAIGKLTDSNHLESLHLGEPADYDKGIIDIYTQSSLYSNDFMQMINKSTPFYIRSNSDYWKWRVNVPYRFPKIVQVPEETVTNATPGIDGQIFTLVLDTAEYTINDIITPHRMYGPALLIVSEPKPYLGGFLYEMTMVSKDPTTEFVEHRWLQPGIELEQIDHSTGEFDQDLMGLGRLGDEIGLYETLGAGYGIEHTITSWADARTLRDENGKPLDIIVYGKMERNQLGKRQVVDVRWEPFIEAQMRMKMMDIKVKRMIWGHEGFVKTRSKKQELKKSSSGLYQKMRNNGNLVQYNRGEFSINMLRDVFGDLFYRRVDMKNRRVKLYTNEAGFEVFQKANKEDLLNSGLTIIADDRFIEGRGQNMMVSYAFNAVTTFETGRIDLVHLRELDLPRTNTEFGQNKKSTPLFLVFDVSPESDGSLANNIREVRQEGQPSMTWGYIDGRRHHLGFAKSQGMTSSSKNPGYTIWMEDRCDIFVEDLSRTVIIEEVPQF